METVIAATLKLDAGQAQKSVQDFKNEIKQAEQDYQILKNTVGETNEATIKAAEHATSLKEQFAMATKSVKSFRQQIKDSQQELLVTSQKFGATSAEASNAAKKVAELRDRMGDANTLVDAFNPDAKFKGFGNVVQAVAGGFSALTGTMALFGVEGANVQKALLKVQAAMAISHGINSILEGADAFKAFGAQIRNTSIVQKTFAVSTALATTVTKGLGLATTTTSTGFKFLRGAIIATGIGALVVGVGLLINNFDSLKKYVMNLIPGLSGVADFIGKIVNSVTDFVGATSEAGRQMEKTIKGLESAIANNEKFLDLNADKYDQYTLRKIQADIDYKKKKVEFLKDDKLTEAEKNNLIKRAEEQRTRLIKSASGERAKAQKKINDDAYKAASDKAKQEHEREMQANAELRTLKQENYLDSIADERKRAEEKARIDFENASRQVNALQVSESIKTDLLKANEVKRILTLQQVKVEFDKKDEDDRKTKEENITKQIKESYDKRLEIIQENEAKVQNELKKDVLDGELTPEDAAIKSLQIKEAFLQEELKLTEQYGYSTTEVLAGIYDTQNAIKKDAADKSIMYDEAEKASKLQLYSAVGAGLGALSQLLGESTRAGKAAALAEIAIGTGVGFINALDIAQKSAKGTGPAAAFAFPIFYASQIAAVIGAASRARSILKAGDSSGAPSIPSVSAAAPLSPQRPQEVNTRLPQDQINQMGNAASPVRAFIVEKDVANNRERITRLNRAAKLGG